MAKLVTNDLVSLANQTTAIANINGNMTLIETAMENTLSRDGTSPNEMEANLDMNSNRVINLVDPVTPQEAATKSYVDDAIDAVVTDGGGVVVRGNYPTVLDYGAVGDGVTNDTAAIQSAVTANAGGILYFPPGTYLVSGSTASPCITLPIAGIKLLGAGKYLSTIKMAAATAAAAIAGIDTSKFEIDGIGFDGQNTSRVAWQRALVLRGVQDSSITNCRFYRIGDGAVLYGFQGFGGSDSYGEGTRQSKRARVSGNEWVDIRGTVCLLAKFTGMEEWEITNNAFRDSCSVAISIESEDSDPSHIAKRTVITGNRINGLNYTYTGGASSIAWGIAYGELSQDCVITNNIIDGVAGDTVSAGVLISTSPSQDDTFAKRVVVSSNAIRNVTSVTGRGFAVLLQAGNADSTDITVLGNTLADSEDGVGIECSAGAATLGYVRGISIVGNTITDVTEFGIIHLTVGGSGELPLIDFVISDNIIRNSGSHGISGFFREGVISNNKIKAAGAVGLAPLVGCEKLTITGNNITDCAASGISGVLNDSLIVGNLSMNNGQGGGTTYGCQLTAGGNNTIHSNVFSDDQGSPTQTYGFRSANVSDQVFNNECIGNVTSGIFGGVASHNDGTYDLAMNRLSTTGTWLEDPGADRIRFWDESENKEAFLSLPAAGIAISGAALTLTDDLAGLEALASTGIVARTASNTYVERTINGTANEITVTNGAGTAGNPTLSLPSTVDLSGKTLPGVWRVIANSGVRVTHTGDTAETTLATINVPAGAMGPNGAVRIWVLYSWTNDASNKTPRIRWNGTAGTIIHGFTATTSNGEQLMITIRNRNSEASQVMQTAAYAGLGNLTSAPLTDTVDTTAVVPIVIRGILADGTDSISVEGYTVEVLYGA